VVLLTQADCHFCEQAEQVLGRIRKDYEIDVRALPVSAPQAEPLLRDGGVLFPPGVFVDGEPFSYGRLSERKLRRELDRRGARK
jgi:glutaredoxin